MTSQPIFKPSGLRLARRSALVLPALALAACGSLLPDYRRPKAPVPEAFVSAPAPGTVAGTAAETPWQDFFTEPALQTLIRRALDNNRDLRVAVRSLEQARAAVDLRRADRWPTVNAGLDLTRGTNSSGGVSSSYSAGLLVTAFEVDVFDRLRSQSDAAFAQYLASAEARKAVQVSLIGSVANSYLAWQADAALEQVAQQTVASREASLRLVQLRYERGASSQLDLSQAQSLLEAARVAQSQATRQRLQDANALQLLVGQPLTPADLSPKDLQSLQFPPVPVGLASEVLLRRPDVAQAEQQLLAAHANIAAARAAFFPKIQLTAKAGSVSSAFESLFSSGSFAWSVVPQLLLPVFDAGRNQANLAQAQAARELAVAQYEKAIQSAFREVADALAGRTTLGEQLQAQEAQTRAEAERARLVDLRYQAGASSYLEVLDAQRALFGAQQAERLLRAQVLQNQATLYRVLGGGWSAEAQP